MKFHSKFCSVFIVLVCLFLPLSAKNIHRYLVSVDSQLTTLSVTAHFADADFYSISANSDKSAACTFDMITGSKVFSPNSSIVRLSGNGADNTLSYKFDLRKAAGRSRRADAYRVGNDLFIPPGMWLWRPDTDPSKNPIEVEFDLPAGIKISVPWQKISSNKYRISPSPADWPSAGAIGKFKTDTVKISGSVMHIAFLDGKYNTTPAQLREWLRNAAKSVCNVYGFFPRKEIQAVLIPVGNSREAVPFAQVVRGGGFSVKFYIDPNRPIEEFIKDWTATHELSHSLLPFIDRDQAWLSEGMATYYQYILMGRDGRLTEQQTWQRICNGFKKGINNSKGKSLQETTENMGSNHAYRFVYWSGAALMFMADVELRRQTGNKESLDRILKKCLPGFLPETRTWTAMQMMDEMDRLSNTKIFNTIYNQNIHSSDFPIDENWLGQLGIQFKDDLVIFNNNAPLAYIRKAILN